MIFKKWLTKKNVFAGTAAVKDTKRECLTPFPRGVTAALWQSRGMAIQSTDLYKSQIMGDILAVLHNSAPTGFLRGAPVTETQALIEFGRMQGYFDCLRLLEGLPDLLPVKEENIESTFPNPEDEIDLSTPE